MPLYQPETQELQTLVPSEAILSPAKTPKQNGVNASPRKRLTGTLRRPVPLLQNENHSEVEWEKSEDAEPTFSFGEAIKAIQSKKNVKIARKLPDTSTMSFEQRQKAILSCIYLQGDKSASELLHLLRNPESKLLEPDFILDTEQHTCLHWAASCAQLKLVALLLDQGANLTKVSTYGDTALMRAITLPSNYHLQSFPELMILLRPTVYARDVDDQTLLHHIAKASCGHHHWRHTRYYGQCIIEFLQREIQRGIYLTDFVNFQDYLGNTALHYACKQKNFKLVDWLLGLKARTDLVNVYNMTPFLYAQRDGRLMSIFQVAVSFFVYKKN